MAFEIFLHPSNLTGGAKAFDAGVVRAFEKLGAQHSAAAETVRLADHAQIHFFSDSDDDIALVTTETMTPEVGRALWLLAEETASFVKVGEEAVRTPAGGDAPTGFAAVFPSVQDLNDQRAMADFLGSRFEDWQAGEGAEVLRQEAVTKAVNDRRAAAATPARHPMPDLVSRPKSSLLRRLSDALFGKAV